MSDFFWQAVDWDVDVEADADDAGPAISLSDRFAEDTATFFSIEHDVVGPAKSEVTAYPPLTLQGVGDGDSGDRCELVAYVGVNFFYDGGEIKPPCRAFPDAAMLAAAGGLAIGEDHVAVGGLVLIPKFSNEGGGLGVGGVENLVAVDLPENR